MFKKRGLSAKVFFCFVSMMLMLSFILVFLSFSIFMMNQAAAKERQRDEKLLLAYYNELQTQLAMIEQSLTAGWQAAEYQRISEPLGEEEIAFVMDGIMEDHLSMQKTYAEIGAIVVYSTTNDISGYLFADGYSQQLESIIFGFAGEINFNNAYDRWEVVELEEKPFLIRAFGTQRAYSICFVDLERTCSLMPEYLRFEGQSFRNQSDRTGWILIVLCAAGMLVLIAVANAVIYKAFLLPLQGFVNTIRRIRKGEENQKLQYTGRITELIGFRDTFNEMMEMVADLKIDSYEKELSRRKAELQVLQGQLKPHFYLNSLKTFYNLLQINYTEKALQMVLWISDMIRYRLHSISELITLSEETEQVKSYGNMQNLCSAFLTRLTFDLPEEVLDCMVPVMCIHTFVENAFKYARMPDRELVVEVSARKTEVEQKQFLILGIQDNGGGFPEAFTDGSWLKEISKYEKGVSTGIYNMWNRLHLLYGNNAGIIFMNNAIGGFCELILPVDRQADDEGMEGK